MLLGAWVSVVTVVLLIVPGACVGRRMTLSWPVAIAAGAPITFAIVSVATVLYGAIGFEWNVITALVAVLVAYALAWVYAALLGTRAGRRIAPAPAATSTSEDGTVDAPLSWRAALRGGIGIALGAIIIAITCIRPIANTAFAGLDLSLIHI